MNKIKNILLVVLGMIVMYGISNAYILNAIDVTYDKKNTTLESDNIQGAIDELGILANTLTDTSDATAIASDITSGKTAYVNGSKVIGTLQNFGKVSDIVTISSGSYSLTPSYLYTDQYAASASVAYTYTAPKNIVAFKFQFTAPDSGSAVSITNIKGTSIINAISDNYLNRTYILEGIKAGETISMDLGYSIWSGYSATRSFPITGIAILGS